MNIEEGNKLIAELLDRFKGSPIEECQDPIVVKIEHDGFSGAEVSTETRPFTYSDLKYHTSWSWLMPVVKKIRDLKKCSSIRVWDDMGCDVMEIENVYNAVVDFIKLYNKKKES